jgi:NodT family efflux transporter outer membrane factor (OMF) lipoprotein
MMQKVQATPAALFGPVRWLLLSLAILLLSGCMVAGPDYRPPELDFPDTWQSRLSGGLQLAQADPEGYVDWWTQLEDPQLNQLIERAVGNNLDIRKAWSRIAEARAQQGISRSDQFPRVDSAAAANRSQSSANVESGAVNNFFQAGLDASWELDLFGRIRRSVEAAQANLETREADLHDVLVSIQAEVALNYLEVRTYQARLAAARGNLAVQQETLEINQSRYEAGLIDELPVYQARYNMEQTRSRIPVLQTGLAQAKNRLATLLGVPPDGLHEELQASRPIPTIPAHIAVGIPAETLRQRPDVRRAERQLARQTALVGVATADLYPRFRLSGSFGLESLTAEDFFTSASRTWGLGPGVSWPVFDGGRIRRTIEVQNERQQQALLDYQHTLLRAREEIENRLVAFAREQLRREALVKATAAARGASSLARERYQAGLVDFSDVLDAQRSLLALEDQLAQSEGDVTANLVHLYRALGGGWQGQRDKLMAQ